MGSAVIFHSCAQGVCHSSRLICSLMTSSATSRLRLNFHHIKVDFKKSEVVLEGEPHLETEFILFQTPGTQG